MFIQGEVAYSYAKQSKPPHTITFKLFAKATSRSLASKTDQTLWGILGSTDLPSPAPTTGRGFRMAQLTMSWQPRAYCRPSWCSQHSHLSTAHVHREHGEHHSDLAICFMQLSISSLHGWEISAHLYQLAYQQWIVLTFVFRQDFKMTFFSVWKAGFTALLLYVQQFHMSFPAAAQDSAQFSRWQWVLLLWILF